MTTRTAATVLGLVLAACSGEPERAQLERIDALEEALRGLRQELAALQNKGTGTTPADFPFRITCQPPLHGYLAQGDAHVTCRSGKASPEGLYPQCNVIFQKEMSVQTKDYFEFATNGTPQLYVVNNYKDEQTQINGVPAFQATFEALRTPLPMKMVGALFPYNEGIFAVTCFAPSATFSDYEEPFRRTINSFQFKNKP